MSLSALVWVFSEDIRPASAKLIMLAFADYADQFTGEAFPSVQSLCDKTSLDRKTVIGTIDDLESRGMLVDTGRRVGVTRQVKVFRMVGLPTGTNHYVYKLTNDETGEFYIGVRSAPAPPHMDESYQGSGKWPEQCRKHNIRLRKEVLHAYDTRQEAEVQEIRLLDQMRDHQLLRNHCLPRNKLLARANRPEIGTVPLFPEKGPVFSFEDSQKRDTEAKDKPLGKSKAIYEDERFEEFWLQYPKRVAKVKARAEWTRLCVTPEMFKAILAGIERQKAGDSWARGFVVDPERFLKHRRWDDEVPKAPQRAQQGGPAPSDQDLDPARYGL